jgi:PAS domain S-box-containing protein
LVPRSLSTRPRTGRAFLAIALLLLAVVGLGVSAVTSYAHTVAEIEHTLDIRRQTMDWLNVVVDAETGARGYVASDDIEFLDPYTHARARERTQAKAVRDLLAEPPELALRARDADRDAHLTMDRLGELVSLVKAGRRKEALAQLTFGEGKLRMDAFRRDVDEIRAGQARLLQRQRTAARGWARTAIVGSVALTLLACGLFALAWRRDRDHEVSITALARDARARLQSLSEMAAALAEAHTRDDVADVIVAQALRGTGAQSCALHELDDETAVLELVADRGMAPGARAHVRRISASEGDPAVLASAKAGLPLWIEDAAATDAAPAPTEPVAARARAYWSVPLVAEGRPLALLSAGYAEPRRFSPDARSFIETMCRHCAQALSRASRLEGEEQARRWLETTLRSIGDAVIATDAAGRVAFMNPVAEALTGWTKAEARGRPLDEVFAITCEGTRATVESPVARVLREGKVVGFANHTQLRSRDGREIPIADSGAPIRTEHGRIVGVVLVFRDATAEQRARTRREFLAVAGEALVSSIDYAETLSTVARCAVPTLADWCSVDLVERGAQAARRVAVAHVDERKLALAQELVEHYPPDSRAARGVAQVIRTGRSELYREIPQEVLEQAARDEEHARMIRALDLRSAMIVPLSVRGDVFGAITFVYAESGRRYSEDDLSFAEDFARRAGMAIENAIALKDAEAGRAREQALRSEAELANRAKDQFLATVSHELRTPLTAILGWATLLRRRKPAPEVDRGLATIERNARLQTKLIEDVLDISRIISGKLVLNVGAWKLADLVASAVETVTPAASLKGITIETELPPEELCLSADADRLQQVVWNLLANAVKFTPKGGRVTVRAGREGSDVWISVTDNGEGIQPSLLPMLFEPFRQADASTTRRHGGLGLGLAIVKQLVVAHGGTVTAQSEGEGRGSTFTVRLPVRAIVPVISAAQPATSARGARAASPADEISRLDGLRVLLVDDEQDALDILAEVLGEQGAEVHEASSARQALDELRQLHPDVLVSDIGMPEMDGFALIQRVRALPEDEGGQTRAIALTAFARREDEQRALAAGYQMHIAKPVEIPRLAKAIATMGREARHH